VSKSDISDASDGAKYWIAGFLHGSVPLPPDDPTAEASWMANRRVFLEVGDWPRL
jgi:hypothetical protein